MPAPEHVAEVVGEWVDKAENDLKNAAHTLTMGEKCPTDTVCFHAQQCVEKYLKAFLVCSSIEFPKTHDIAAIMLLMREQTRPKLTIGEQRTLTTYATVARYPGYREPITLADARRAVSIARRVRKEIRRLLPKEALRRRRA
jgi:HEPN domain-containing protein